MTSATHSTPLEPLVLEGAIVRLEPLRREHAMEFARVGLDPSLWELQPKIVDSADAMREYVDSALADQERGMSLPFAIMERASDRVIGSTRFMDIALPHRRLEIGATWLAPSAQRSGANTEAKLLLLTYAFESLGMIRVVFKTEAQNTKSRNALLRIGATEEGTFRQHLIAESGRRRDMVYFAILESEWPAVKTRLRGFLDARNASSAA